MTSFDRDKAKANHVTEINNRKAHQMAVNMERNLLAKFHKDERNVSK